MPRQFYTEKDIEDLVQSGVKSLQITDQVVLTELAYEKAQRLGLQLLSDRPETPPAAPVRPYLSDGQTAHAQPRTDPVSPAAPRPQPVREAPRPRPPGDAVSASDVEQRIRSAVIARLGNQVDAELLDNIIHRVVKSTGLK